MKYYFIIVICLLSFSHVFGHVGITYPKGGETFNAGDTISIQWQVLIDHGENNWDLYFSTDGGSNWSEINLNISKSQLRYEWIVPGNSTNNAKVLVVQDNAIGADYQSESGDFTITSTTGITDNDNRVKEFFIYPAYPNPFNSTTVISFSLPEQSNVKLNIFNIAGQKIKTLVNSDMQPGLHKVSWNADDVPSGVYFYTIETKYALQTRKVILLK